MITILEEQLKLKSIQTKSEILYSQLLTISLKILLSIIPPTEANSFIFLIEPQPFLGLTYNLSWNYGQYSTDVEKHFVESSNLKGNLTY